jgi:hypothetical protein
MVFLQVYLGGNEPELLGRIGAALPALKDEEGTQRDQRKPDRMIPAQRLVKIER